MSAIEVENLHKSYGDLKAVDGLSLDVEEGEVFGLLGPNGAGKTTTVEILIGLRQRDSGNVRVMGFDPAQEGDAVKAQIGVQLQQTQLYPLLSVEEILRLFASFYSNSVSIDDLLELVGLHERRKAKYQHLSGGQKQRLSLALTLINDPELVFLDEPTTGLDPQARRALGALWNRCARKVRPSCSPRTTWKRQKSYAGVWLSSITARFLPLGRPAI